MAKKVPINIPARLQASDVVHITFEVRDLSNYLKELQELSQLDNESIVDCLGISLDAFESYKVHGNLEGNEKIKEHIIMLIALFKHGIEVFGSAGDFKKWLKLENFHFRGKEPFHYLKFIYGIKLLDDRLTGMEYGDNA